MCILLSGQLLQLRHYLNNTAHFQRFQQCPLFCTQRTYCDFVVWTQKEVHISNACIYVFGLSACAPLLQCRHTSRTSRPAAIEELIEATAQLVASFNLWRHLQCSSTVEETRRCKVLLLLLKERKGEIRCRWFHFQLSSKPKSRLWYCPDCKKFPD